MKILRQLGIVLPLFLTALTLVGQEKRSASDSLLLHPEEMKYLKNIKQLTFGGNNAEAYWSFDDSKLVFQSDFAKWGNSCDQMFYLDWKKTYINFTKVH